MHSVRKLFRVDLAFELSLAVLRAFALADLSRETSNGKKMTNGNEVNCSPFILLDTLWRAKRSFL